MVLFVNLLHFAAGLPPGCELSGVFVFAVSVFVSGDPEVPPLSPETGNHGSGPGGAIVLVGSLLGF